MYPVSASCVLDQISDDDGHTRTINNRQIEFIALRLIPKDLVQGTILHQHQRHISSHLDRRSCPLTSRKRISPLAIAYLWNTGEFECRNELLAVELLVSGFATLRANAIYQLIVTGRREVECGD